MIRPRLNNFTAILLMGVLLVFAFSCGNRQKIELTDKKVSVNTPTILVYYQKALDSATFYLSMMDTSKLLAENRTLLTQSRKWYKIAEPILISYDHENYKTINAPNLLKVEIDDFTDIKKFTPKSYQVLEELLFSNGQIDNERVQNTLVFLNARLPFLKTNHMIHTQSDRHHLRMLREAIVNVATKGITGFDSPMLANSLQEAVYNYETIEVILTDLYQDAFTDRALLEKWEKELASTRKVLSESEFDTFDRYAFITNHTNKQLLLIKQTAEDWGIELSKSYALNPDATNLFAENFFNLDNFAPPHSPNSSTEVIDLGKALFNDASLSGSGMSCASCHAKDKAFTDGFRLAKGNDGKDLQRNSPTLKYSAYQRLFFWDGVSSSLESQIIPVLNNAKEFHTDLEQFEAKVKADKNYQATFTKLYGKEPQERNIRHAIASYIRSLSPFNSKFDKSIKDEGVLDQIEVDGFNLFMGKAACATCHFPPTFNGTVPPKYLETEFENLGTPANNDFAHPVLDKDPGAYEPYKVEERRHFFKTPTVRNVSLTAPYMHNGVYDSLEQVVTFYNVGGGAGMGLDVPYQTLPPDSLNLTAYEIKAIVRFMETLTDQPDARKEDEFQNKVTMRSK